MISGYFLSVNRPFFIYLKGKVKSLLIPYYFTSICIILLSIIVSLILGKSVEDNVIKWIGGMLYGAGVPSFNTILPDNYPIFIGALWFLWALFWATLLVRIIVQFISNIFIASLLVAGLFFTACYTAKIVWLPIDIQAGMAACLFVYIGWLARKYNILYKKAPIDILIVLFIVSLISIYNFTALYMVECNFGNVFISIPGALSISYLILFLCKKVEHTKIGKIMSWYGVNSIVILAFHIIELDLVPWRGLIKLCKAYDVNVYIIYIMIIFFKFLWVSFGVCLSRKCELLYCVFYRR